jgi:NAD-dependent dihydropyrimidine dehydrogenase PreA subunit
MPYVVTANCIDTKDRSCIEVCPVDCIYETDRMLVIHPDECIDCTACVPVCPVEAIVFAEDIDPDQVRFVPINALIRDGIDGVNVAVASWSGCDIG